MTNANENTAVNELSDAEAKDIKDSLFEHGMDAIGHLERLHDLVSGKLIDAEHKAAEDLTEVEREIYVAFHIEQIRSEEPFLTEMVNEEDAVQKIASDIYAFKKFATAVAYRVTFMEELEEAGKK